MSLQSRTALALLALPLATWLAGCASSPGSTGPGQRPAASVVSAAESVATVAAPTVETKAMGAIVIDDLPSDTAEVYEDDVPMTFDVGEARAIGAGIHIVSLVVATKTVWASKISIAPGATVHVRIPAKYLTAYQ